MYHFFAEPSDISGHDIYLRGGDYNHIRNVLRMKTGEVISVSDGISGNEYRCHILEFTDEAVHCRLDFIKEADTELPVRIFLFQSLPKGDKMDYIVQKCTEAGVRRIVPVNMPRCVARLEGKADKKLIRWNRIAREAAKQALAIGK